MTADLSPALAALSVSSLASASTRAACVFSSDDLASESFEPVAVESSNTEARSSLA